MRRSGLAAALYVLLIFASGVVVGAFGYRLYLGSAVSASAGTTEYRQRYIADMQARLRLDEGQVARLRIILDSIREEYRTFRENHKPELQAIQDSQVRKINAILTNNQRAEYDKMREEREKLRKEARK
jgi:hypothetical protein